MDTTKEFKQIDNFLHNLYLNQEVSTTETLNFLKVYGDYILKSNNIYPEYLQIDIKPLKKMSNSDLANMYQDEKEEHHFYISLIKQNLNAKNSDEIDKIFMTIIDYGHEITHLVQFINHRHQMNKYFDKEDKYDEIYNKTIINKMLTKKQINKFERAMVKCNKALHWNTKTEKSADESAYYYIINLLEQSFNIHNYEVDYMNFLLDYTDKLLYDRSLRKLDCKIFHNRYKQAIKVLTKKYGIKKEDLLIP